MTAQELCEIRGDRPGSPVPNSPYGLCGRNATVNLNWSNRAQGLCESRGGRPGLPVPNSPCGTRGRKSTLSDRTGLCDWMMRNSGKWDSCVVSAITLGYSKLTTDCNQNLTQQTTYSRRCRSYRAYEHLTAPSLRVRRTQ